MMLDICFKHCEKTIFVHFHHMVSHEHGETTIFKRFLKYYVNNRKYLFILLHLHAAFYQNKYSQWHLLKINFVFLISLDAFI